LLEEGSACQERLVVAHQSIDRYKTMQNVRDAELNNLHTANIELKNKLNKLEARQAKMNGGRWIWISVGAVGGFILCTTLR
jgi:hypothetical protein